MKYWKEAIVYAGVAELADALGSGSSGRPWGFESLHPHHFFYRKDTQSWKGVRVA